MNSFIYLLKGLLYITFVHLFIRITKKILSLKLDLYYFNSYQFFLKIVSTILVQVERKKGFIKSGIQWIFYFLSFLAGLLIFVSKTKHAVHGVRLQ